jgi:hypothetical protein
MDHINDYLNFKRLVMRLCVTFDKFANDELIESWWKALKDVPYKNVENGIDAFIAKADEKTKFPRPAQFRGGTLFADPADAARSCRLTEQSQRHWNSFIAQHPTTGPMRLRMAKASQILASAREDSPAYAEAQHEYLQLEKQLGPNGRFSADA